MGGGSYLQELPACAGLPRLLLPRRTANETRGWDLPELPQAPPGLFGHIPCGMWLGEGHKSLSGQVGPRHAPIHVCCVAGGPAASAVERLAWRSQRVFGQPGAGKVMSAVTISSASAAGMTLLLFCHWESQRTSPMSLCDAKMLPESPPCPLGCSNADPSRHESNLFRGVLFMQMPGRISRHSHLPRQVFNKSWKAGAWPEGGRVGEPGGEAPPGI